MLGTFLIGVAGCLSLCGPETDWGPDQGESCLRSAGKG